MPIFTSNDLRGRVERLLRGETREQDLYHLLFNMREEAGGKGIVSEIAHFLAHPKLRTQGMVTNELRDLFAFLKFRIPTVESRIIRTVLAPTVPNALRANLRRMRASILKRETGMAPARARIVLEDILKRMSPTPGGDLKKPILLTREEHRVFECVASYVKGGPLFSEEDLLKDFTKLLQQLALLDKSEVGLLAKRKTALSLFALTAMHNREVDLADGSIAELAICRDIFGNLGIFGIAKINIDGSAMQTGAWLFKTSLRVEKYCEEGVAPIGRYPFLGALEITAEEKLTRVI